ncbi:MAG: hypothetical protein DWQ45_17920 [Planctomycetota bacterium]|nr:MAG: hypothetical protein DWQ45_17920 [Planctomycetota bacterium]
MSFPSSHRKRIQHFPEPVNLHELTFSTYQRRPLLTICHSFMGYRRTSLFGTVRISSEPPNEMLVGCSWILQSALAGRQWHPMHR